MEIKDELLQIAKDIGVGFENHLENNIKFDSRDFRNHNYADWKYEKISEQIKEFQDGLSDDFDVVIRLISFGNNNVMFVSELGYQNPDLLYFYGTIDGKQAQIIQHISQLNFLLLAVPRQDKSKPPQRIGFDTSTLGNNSDEVNE